MAQFFLRRRSLSFGAGYPAAFDPSHPAARGMSRSNGMSVITTGGGNWVNLLDNQISVHFRGSGGEIPANRAYIGTCASCPATGAGNTFSGNNAANAPNVCMAWIGVVTDTTHTNTVMSNTTLTAGTQLLTNANNTFILNNWAGSNFGATITYTANDPYFIAMSGNVNTSVGVGLNLRTGKLQTATGTGATPNTGLDGIYMVGNFAIGGSTGLLYWSRGMYNPNFISLKTLVWWAQTDPWGFWHPSARSLISYDPVYIGGSVASAPPIAGGFVVYP